MLVNVFVARMLRFSLALSFPHLRAGGYFHLASLYYTNTYDIPTIMRDTGSLCDVALVKSPSSINLHPQLSRAHTAYQCYDFHYFCVRLLKLN